MNMIIESVLLYVLLRAVAFDPTIAFSLALLYFAGVGTYKAIKIYTAMAQIAKMTSIFEQPKGRKKK